jgi:hypothetical protein
VPAVAGPVEVISNAVKGLNFRLLSTISAAGGWRGRAKSAGQTLTLNFPQFADRRRPCGSKPGARGRAFCGTVGFPHPFGAFGRRFGGHLKELSFDGA